MAKSKFSDEKRAFIEDRAGGLCEYCKASVVFSPHRFTIDHIRPPMFGGTDELDNLAHSCFGCNRCKHDKIAAIDPFSQQEAPLFNPRIQIWKEHFVWHASFIHILGLTPTGRATVAALQLNRSQLVRMRKELIEVDRHPPKED
ncbi:MAG: HNH endonuclease signature motif containing protein [Saprospiraceae bacterium]